MIYSTPVNTGWIEMIVGPMFSGKTEELIRRLNRARYAKQDVFVFKPLIDDRFSKTKVVSRNKSQIHSLAIEDPQLILEKAKQYKVIGIDEVQFFPDSIVEVVNTLADTGKRVIATGLDLDFKAQPFQNVASLMAQAEYITKLLAICLVCGNPACRSQRLSTGGEGRILVGDSEAYEARCRKCFSPTPQPPAPKHKNDSK
ncbi:MAG: thymidine kinase [Myxococcota bacterium]